MPGKFKCPNLLNTSCELLAPSINLDTDENSVLHVVSPKRLTICGFVTKLARLFAAHLVAFENRLTNTRIQVHEKYSAAEC